jgi:nitrogen fixation-related uncharacterized protein
MGRACGKYREEQKYIVFWWGHLTKEDQFKDIDEDGNTILKES